MAPPKKPGFAPTLSAAAGRTGLPVTLLKRLKDKGLTCFKPNNRVDCDELMEWIKSNPQEVGQVGDIPDKRVEDALLTRAKREREEQRLKVEREQLIPKSEARRDAARCILGTKQRLLASVESNTAAATMKLQLTPSQTDDLRKILYDDAIATMKLMQQGAWTDLMPTE